MGLSEFQINMLRSLWSLLTPKETIGLLAPDTLIQKKHDLVKKRQENLLHLLDLERQMHELRCEVALVNTAGKIIRADTLDSIRQVEFSPVIESISEEGAPPELLVELKTLLASAAEVNQFIVLERLIRLQKIVLHAERMILKMNPEPVAVERPDRRWFEFWKLKACQLTNGALQHLWVKVLVRQLVHPNCTRLKTLDHMASFDLQDAKDLGCMEGWLIGDCLHIVALQEKTDQTTQQALKRIMQNGWLDMFSPQKEVAWHSESKHEFRASFQIATKTYQATASYSGTTVKYAAYPLSPLGQELCGLVDPVQDQEYIDNVIASFRRSGVDVNKITK